MSSSLDWWCLFVEPDNFQQKTDLHSGNKLLLGLGLLAPWLIVNRSQMPSEHFICFQRHLQQVLAISTHKRKYNRIGTPFRITHWSSFQLKCLHLPVMRKKVRAVTRKHLAFPHNKQKKHLHVASLLRELDITGRSGNGDSS